MSKIDSGLGVSFLSEQVQPKSVKEPKSQKAKAAETEQAKGAKQPQLSDAAQKLLEKLKKTHKDMDFMVADYESGSEAKSILSRGTKEYSVLFSTEELEKMASDEKYEQEYMDKVQQAIDMSGKINEQFGFGEDSDKGELTNVGISFNSDGTTTLFAQLEKTSKEQSERIEESRAKRAEERKKAESKSVTVQASSEKELVKKLNEVDWDKVKKEKKTPGDKFDFTA